MEPPYELCVYVSQIHPYKMEILISSLLWSPSAGKRQEDRPFTSGAIADKRIIQFDWLITIIKNKGNTTNPL